MAGRACIQRGPGKCQESPKLLGAAGLCIGVALGMQKACHGLRISFPALCCTCWCAAFPGTLFCLGKQALSMTGWGSPHYICPPITSFRCRLKAGSTLHARLASSWPGPADTTLAEQAQSLSSEPGHSFWLARTQTMTARTFAAVQTRSPGTGRLFSRSSACRTSANHTQHICPGPALSSHFPPLLDRQQ